MTNTITKQDRDELLNALMLENHITFDDVYNCAEQNMSGIKEMMSIFDHKNDRDRRLSMELIGLLSQSQGDRVITFYSGEYYPSVNIKNLYKNFSKDDVKLLITACMYNPAFFSYALRLCERIKSTFDVRQNTQIPPLYRKVKPEPIYKLAATGTIDDFIEFFTEFIDYKSASGTLRFMGNDQQEVYIEYIFDRFQDEIPFKLEFYFKTAHDNKEHPIIIPAEERYQVENHDGKIVAIRSDIESDIDYSKGIANWEINLRPIDDH
jgi:hypothetical protein